MPSIIALAGLVSLSSVHATAVCHPETAPAEDGLIAYQDCGDRAVPPIILIPSGSGVGRALYAAFRYRSGYGRHVLRNADRRNTAGSSDRQPRDRYVSVF